MLFTRLHALVNFELGSGEVQQNGYSLESTKSTFFEIVFQKLNCMIRIKNNSCRLFFILIIQLNFKNIDLVPSSIFKNNLTHVCNKEIYIIFSRIT